MKLNVNGAPRKLTPYSRFPAPSARAVDGIVTTDEGTQYPAAATYWKQGDRYCTYVQIDGKVYYFADRVNFVQGPAPVEPAPAAPAPAEPFFAETLKTKARKAKPRKARNARTEGRPFEKAA